MRAIAFLCGLLLVSCHAKQEPLSPSAEPSGCGLELDELAGTQWVVLKRQPDNTDIPDVTARLRVYEQDGVTRARYTGGSLTDVLDYRCEQREGNWGPELFCREKPEIEDLFVALFVSDETVPPYERIHAIDDSITPAQYEAGARAALERIALHQDTDQWRKFVFQNNNLGNKLQHQIWLRIDERQCRLIISDMYMTIYNGKMLIDANAVGTSPMVASDEELLFDHCGDTRDLIPTKSQEPPASASDACAHNRGCFFEPGETAYFHDIGDPPPPPGPGCTDGFDTWRDWRPVGRDRPLTPQPHWSTSFTDAGLHVVHTVKHRSCKRRPREVLEVSCALVALP